MRTTVMKSGTLNLLEPSRPVQACTGIALPSPFVQYFAMAKTCYGRCRSYKDVPIGRFCSKSIKFDLVHMQKWLQESEANKHVGNEKAALFYSIL